MTSEIWCVLLMALSNFGAGRMTVYTQLKSGGGMESWGINDVHRMFWLFSSWCVKGELGLWDSRLGTPWGRSSREKEETERLIWYSSYSARPVLGLDILKRRGGLEEIHICWYMEVFISIDVKLSCSRKEMTVRVSICSFFKYIHV